MKSFSRALFFKITLLTLVVLLVLYVNVYAVQNETVMALASRFHYWGVFAISILSGFNLVVPIPAVSFFPFFREIGLSPTLLIVTMSLGMVIGDSVGYLLGHVGRDVFSGREHALFKKIEQLRQKHKALPMLFLFLYAAFVPLPNELVVIPMAFLRYRFAFLFIAVLLGNIMFNLIGAFGIHTLFSAL